MRMGGHGPILIGERPVTAEVTAGAEVVVEAAENPTTGFVWQLEAEPADAIEWLQDEFVPDGGAPGSGGRRRWTFRVLRGPRVALQGALRRSWDASSAPARIAVATILVNDQPFQST
jgi:predicted secreted protein